MATTITYESYGPHQTGQAISLVSGTISQADMSFLNISNPLVPVATVVTADKIRTHLIGAAAAITAGIPPGQYEKKIGTTFRKVGS